LRFLADENVHPVVVARLRAAGFVVEWIAETAKGSSDQSILNRDNIGEFILITFDRDFGDLIFNKGYARPYSIIYSRLGRAEPRHIADRIGILIAEGIPAQHMIVITSDTVRLKAFPSGVLE
jgi:predicted nuclease of predicted toxin-antitoxin system